MPQLPEVRCQTCVSSLKVGSVGSTRGAVLALRSVRFHGSPTEPGVRLSPHRALHVGLLVRWWRLSVSTGWGYGIHGSGTG